MMLLVKVLLTWVNIFKEIDESERPDKVIMVIFTDGEENSSKEYTVNVIRKMIKHQKEKYLTMETSKTDSLSDQA